MPHLPGVEQPRRDGRPAEPRAVAAPRGRSGLGGAVETRRGSPMSARPTGRRLPVGIAELDRVLGGGLVPGSLVLVGGEPGIGKSTLLLQAAAGVAAAVGPERVLYATGEESAGPGPPPGRPPRAAGRPGRAGSGSSPRSSIDRIVERARRRAGPALLVVDSIQTATVDELDGAGRQRRPGPRRPPCA